MVAMGNSMNCIRMQPTSHLLYAVPDTTKMYADQIQTQRTTAHPILSNRRQTINSLVSHQIPLDEFLAHDIMHLILLPKRQILRFLIYFLVSCKWRGRGEKEGILESNFNKMHTNRNVKCHTHFCPYVRSNSTVSNVLYFSVSTGWYQRTILSRSARSFSLSTFDLDCVELVVPLAVFFNGFVGDFCATPPLFWAFSCWCCSDILKPTLCSWTNQNANNTIQMSIFCWCDKGKINTISKRNALVLDGLRLAELGSVNHRMLRVLNWVEINAIVTGWVVCVVCVCVKQVAKSFDWYSI